MSSLVWSGQPNFSHSIAVKIENISHLLSKVFLLHTLLYLPPSSLLPSETCTWEHPSFIISLLLMITSFNFMFGDFTQKFPEKIEWYTNSIFPRANCCKRYLLKQVFLWFITPLPHSYCSLLLLRLYGPRNPYKERAWPFYFPIKDVESFGTI